MTRPRAQEDAQLYRDVDLLLERGVPGDHSFGQALCDLGYDETKAHRLVAYLNSQGRARLASHVQNAAVEIGIIAPPAPAPEPTMTELYKRLFATDPAQYDQFVQPLGVDQMQRLFNHMVFSVEDIYVAEVFIFACRSYLGLFEVDFLADLVRRFPDRASLDRVVADLDDRKFDALRQRFTGEQGALNELMLAYNRKDAMVLLTPREQEQNDFLEEPFIRIASAARVRQLAEWLVDNNWSRSRVTVFIERAQGLEHNELASRIFGAAVAAGLLPPTDFGELSLDQLLELFDETAPNRYVEIVNGLPGPTAAAVFSRVAQSAYGSISAPELFHALVEIHPDEAPDAAMSSTTVRELYAEDLAIICACGGEKICRHVAQHGTLGLLEKVAESLAPADFAVLVRACQQVKRGYVARLTIRSAKRRR